MLLEVQNLSKRYGQVQAVQDISFTINTGEFIGFLGGNGAGKSTTIKMLTGQLFPSAGNILVQGKNILEDANFVRSQIGYVPEFPEMYEYLTGKEMLEFVISVRGKGDLQRGMEIAGLGKNIDRVISEYSQGMRRKIAIAAALVAEPPILVLDEALNGLDPSSVKRMTGLLCELRQEGTAIILSTHILDYLEKIATRLLYLVDGKLEADCSISDLQRIREML